MRRSLSLLTVSLLVSASAASAQTSRADEELYKLLQEQKQQLEMQRKQLEAQQRALESQERKFEELQQQITDLSDEKPADPFDGEKDEPAAAPQKRATTAAGAPSEVGTERKPVDEEKPPEIAAQLDEGGVLLRKGALLLIPSVEYTRSSATKVAIEGFSIIPALNIGLFQVSKVGRDILSSAIAARFGITNRFEVEGKVPYVFRREATTGRPVGLGAAADTTSTLTGSGIGDVEAGAHYQINKGKGGWPFFIANMRFKSNTGTGPFEVPTDVNGQLLELPTGSGFYAFQPSVTAIYPSDPVVYYANLGYLHNVARDFGGTIGEIDAGDSVSGAFGMSMSLNDRASFSLGYSHSTVFESTQNGNNIPNSDILQVGALDLGYAYQLTDRYSVNFNVSAGVTEDAPDARLGVRVPIKFNMY